MSFNITPRKTFSRNRIVTVRFTESEHESLLAAAKAQNEPSLSEFSRAIMNEHREPIAQEVLSKLGALDQRSQLIIDVLQGRRSCEESDEPNGPLDLVDAIRERYSR